MLNINETHDEYNIATILETACVGEAVVVEYHERIFGTPKEEAVYICVESESDSIAFIRIYADEFNIMTVDELIRHSECVNVKYYAHIQASDIETNVVYTRKV